MEEFILFHIPLLTLAFQLKKPRRMRYAITDYIADIRTIKKSEYSLAKNLTLRVLNGYF